LSVGFFLRAPETPRQVQFEIAPDAKLAQVGSPRISPDGRIIAFQAIDSDGNGQIWLRPLDSLEVRPLAGTEGAVTNGRPMWSPDSRYIAFFAGGKLKKVPVAGGPAQTICDANGADGSWSTRGEIVFDGQANAPLMRVSAAGGIARAEVSQADFEETPSLGWPEFLPDGKRFLFVGDVTGEEGTIMLHEVGTSENTALTPADSRVQYAEPGYLIYVLDGMLVAHPFDAGKGELTGEPMPLADNVGSCAVGLAYFSAAADGTLVFRSGESGGRRLLWYDRAGRELGAVSEGSEFRSTCLSPDGSKVVSGIADDDSGNRDLWIHDLDRGVASRFTFDPATDSNPLWSPDAKQIVFSSTRDEKRGLYRKDASGVGPVELLLEVEAGANASAWSADGRFLLYMTQGAETSWDIWALPMDGSAEPFPVLQSEFREVRPSFSPDGKWFSYGSNESGRSEVYVRQFPGPGGQWQVSTDGGSESVWSTGGREIFFLDVGGNLSIVSVETGATFTAGLPEVLFDPAVFPTVQRNRYLATPDGERFLVLATMSGESIRPTIAVLNWSAGLDN
jgi:Tol biopolymer transport system component